MNSEEIKQTNIYNYFQNNKRNIPNFRYLDENFLPDTLKKQQLTKKDKRFTDSVNLPKSNNFKIKDFFSFKEFPEEITEIQKDLKNMNLYSENGYKSCGFSNNNIHKISSFNSTIENNLNIKDKKQNFEINKYFPVINKDNNINLLTDKHTVENINNEIEKVFTLDHFHNISEKHTNEFKQIINSELINSSREINLEEFSDKNKIDTEILKKKILTENLRKNYFIYQDTKITKYIHIIDPPNMKLNRELLVNVLEYIDIRNLMKKIPPVCKFWKDLYYKTISSPNYNIKLDTTDISKISEREINELFKRGKHLKHIKLLKEITEDFGGNKGVENFNKRIALIMTLSDPKEIHHKGIMLSSFKLRPRKINEMHNLISIKSISLICDYSKYSLKILILRNCSKLNNKVLDGISSCVFLTTLEISFNE